MAGCRRRGINEDVVDFNVNPEAENSQAENSQTPLHPQVRRPQSASLCRQLERLCEEGRVDDQDVPIVSQESRGSDYGQEEHEMSQPEEVADDTYPVEYPGGPLDTSVLVNFKDHVALTIWNNEKDRGLLRCINHSDDVQERPVDKGVPINRFEAIIRQSSLSWLVDCSYPTIDRMLVSLFVERWYPETNTFHLPFGEMTISLDDVWNILGLPITGKTVSVDPISSAEAAFLVHKYLRCSKAEAEAELHRSTKVNLGFLRDRFKNVDDTQSEGLVQAAARAYLLHLLGSTIFADKTGIKISVAYLKLLIDVHQVHTYAWGTACLAYLYRQLGAASRDAVRQITGALSLLQAWVFEHFRFISTPIDHMYNDSKPCCCRWKPNMRSGNTEHSLHHYRVVVDKLSAQEVIWAPYENHRNHYPFNEVSWFSGSIRCMDVVEPYHVTRVLRQFGRVQTIPEAPIRPRTRSSRGNTGHTYRPDYTHHDYIWENWQHHVIAPNARSVPIIRPWDCTEEYMGWYARISHPILVNPVHSTLFDAPSSGVVAESSRLLQDNNRLRLRNLELEERHSAARTLSRRLVVAGTGTVLQSDIMLMHNTLFPEETVQEASSSQTSQVYNLTYRRRRRNLDNPTVYD